MHVSSINIPTVSISSVSLSSVPFAACIHKHIDTGDAIVIPANALIDSEGYYLVDSEGYFLTSSDL